MRQDEYARPCLFMRSGAPTPFTSRTGRASRLAETDERPVPTFVLRQATFSLGLYFEAPGACSPPEEPVFFTSLSF